MSERYVNAGLELPVSSAAMAAAPRLLQLTLHSGQGGMETVAQALHQGLVGSGWHVATVPLDAQGSDQLARLRHVRRLIRQISPSCVLSHSAIPNLYSRAAAPLSIPTVAVLHSASDDWMDLRLRAAEWLLSRRTQRVIAVSPAQKDQYGSCFPWVGNRLVVIQNGTSVTATTPRNQTNAEPHLLFAARIAKTKRPHVLVEALRLLKDRGHEPLTTIAGQWDDSAYARELSERLTDYGLTKVHLCGPRTDIAPLMLAADLLVHPSAAEAHSLTLIEAAVSGLPSLVADTVDSTLHPSMVRRVFPLDDASEMATQIQIALSERGALLKLAADRRLEMGRLFGSSAMVSAYDGLLRQVLRSGARST